MKTLYKISQYSGWVLLLFMVLYFVTGYGRLWNAMDPVLAKTIHEKILPIPTIIAIVAHISFRLKIIFSRKNEPPHHNELSLREEK
ncbi:hypothetical protein AMJ47_00640 [Parcubacteria bacterium DG_72]|nr:MAG: hypothetical protein AMJ47_00640 [Parcubacteria bacterium DG_72]